MECLLRAQMHFELAKCDEEIEQIQTAAVHLRKAIALDDENVYKEQLMHQLKRLELRGELYKTPERVEEQAAMILEQCVVGNKLNGSKDRMKLKPALADLIKIYVTKSGGDNSSGGGGGGMGNEINTHSLLLRVGDLLAPNEFTHVLESETFKADFGKLNEDQVSKLAKKVENYEYCVRKCENYLLERLNDLERDYRRSKGENAGAGTGAGGAVSLDELERMLKLEYKERLKLWFDLCKIARKQQIWDICRVSCRFCLLYDNEQMLNRFLSKKSGGSGSSVVKMSANKKPAAAAATTLFECGNLFERELMRNLAEAHFIFGESLVQYLRGEGVELFEKPKTPTTTHHDDHHHHHHVHQPKEGEQQVQHSRDFNTDAEWLAYTTWIANLCQEAVKQFLRGIQIGCQLNESWLVCQGAAYIWNYLHHLFEQKKYAQVNGILVETLDALRRVGHGNEPELLVFITIALANGLMMPWLPADQVKQLQVPSIGDANQTASAGEGGKGATNKSPTRKDNKTDKAAAAAAAATKNVFSIPSEANADIRKALEICENAMNVTSGENAADLVGLKHRLDLIKTWVLAKQVNQSAIKNLGVKSNAASSDRKQDKYTKCMIGIEILNRNLKLSSAYTSSQSHEIKDAPSIKEMISLIESVENWPDKLVELQLWSNLAVLASKTTQTDNLRSIHTKTLGLVSHFEKVKSENK